MLDEVGPIIPYDYAGATETWKYDLFKELGHNLPIISLSGYDLHPLGNIINSNQNILVSKG